MIANLNLLNILDSIEIQPTKLPASGPKANGKKTVSFSKALNDAVSASRGEGKSSISNLRNKGSARPSPAMFSIRTRGKPQTSQRDFTEKPNLSASFENGGRGPQITKKIVTSSGTQQTQGVLADQNASASQSGQASPNIPDANGINAEITTSPGKSKDDGISKVAEELQSELAKILEKWSKAAPSEKAAVLDEIKNSPVLAGFFEFITKTSGQPLEKILDEHSMQELLAPLTEVLPLLSDGTLKTPDELAAKLSDASKESKFWKEFQPSKLIQAFAKLLEGTASGEGKGSLAVGDPAILAQAIGGTASGEGKSSLADQKMSLAVNENQLGFIQKLLRRATSRDNQETKPPATVTSNPSYSKTDGDSNKRASTAIPAQPKAEKDLKTTLSEAPKAVQTSTTQPASSPAAQTDPRMSEAIPVESVTSPKPATKGIDLTQGPSDKAIKVLGNPASNNNPSGNSNFSPGDHTPERLGSQLSRPSDPLRAALFSQFIEKAEMFNVGSEKKVMTIQLNPESLGKLNLELTSKDGSVSARITTENTLVREKLEQIIPQIKEHLAEQGINLNAVTVDVSSRQSDGKKENFSHGKSRSTFSIHEKAVDENQKIIDVAPAIRRMALNIRQVDLTV